MGGGGYLQNNAFTLTELIGVVIILALIALLAFPPILNAIRSTKGKISDASKEILYNAVGLYVSDNINNYPKYNGNKYCVTVNELVKGEYLPTTVYDSVTGDEIPQDSKIEINIENDIYSYNFNDECKEYYKYGPLIKVLLSQYNESNTTGLVKDSTNENIYYYTGTNEEVSNNFLWYGGHQWRVLEFDTKENTLTLITQQPLTAIQPASSVWTNEETYNSSYINTWLNEYFWNSLDSSIQKNILDNTFNVGIYSDVDEITTTQKVGLLDEEQYVRAGGIDSFINLYNNFFLGNRYDNVNIRTINNSNKIINLDASKNSNGIRPIIKISDIIILDGNGSLTFNYKTNVKATNSTNIQNGEYINISTTGEYCGNDKLCTFRVVSKNSNGIKVTLNGLLPNLSEYGNSQIITLNHTIYDELNDFINSIQLEFTTIGNFNIGSYETNSSYILSTEKILQSNIGLPTVGELFTGNDIAMGNIEKFVDINTIENSNIIEHYWTMNSNLSNVRYLNNNGGLSNISISSKLGVRPVIFLKNNLEFTGGDGTAQNPYTLD